MMQWLGMVVCGRASLVAGLLLVSSSHPGLAERQRSTPVARDSGGVMHQIAEGVFAIVHDDPVHAYPDGSIAWPHGNTGVVVGEHAVLVVDSSFYPSRAEADIALIRTVTGKPVRYLVNTHGDPDHINGNAVYKEAFPGLEIASARGNTVAVAQERFTRGILAEGSAVRRTFAEHEQLLPKGIDGNGRPLTKEERTLLSRVIDEERRWLQEFATVGVAAPTLLVDDQLRIDLGNRTVELRNWGGAHTPADVSVWVPGERVLFTGDLVAHPVPYVYGRAYPTKWASVLRAFEAMPVAAVVPGHGPIFSDHRFLALQRELFEVAVKRMEGLVSAGTTPEDARGLLDLSDFRGRFLKEGDVNSAVWDVSIRAGLPESVYQCVYRKRC